MSFTFPSFPGSPQLETAAQDWCVHIRSRRWSAGLFLGGRLGRVQRLWCRRVWVRLRVGWGVRRGQGAVQAEQRTRARGSFMVRSVRKR